MKNEITKKELTEKDYEEYMKSVDRYIKKAEIIINDLPSFRIISELSFEDWVKFQNGDLKIERKNGK
jgi:hypothetical protein